jgi:hypothetical protein
LAHTGEKIYKFYSSLQNSPTRILAYSSESTIQ